MTDLPEPLRAMVEAGTLTPEQADTIHRTAKRDFLHNLGIRILAAGDNIGRELDQ